MNAELTLKRRVATLERRLENAHRARKKREEKLKQLYLKALKELI